MSKDKQYPRADYVALARFLNEKTDAKIKVGSREPLEELKSTVMKATLKAPEDLDFDEDVWPLAKHIFDTAPKPKAPKKIHVPESAKAKHPSPSKPRVAGNTAEWRAWLLKKLKDAGSEGIERAVLLDQAIHKFGGTLSTWSTRLADAKNPKYTWIEEPHKLVEVKRQLTLEGC